ncbi:MAG TPA: HEAT repeat domain-containing protein [Thermoanaerobaculaceae bacterium]|nr:HEAT repeat domain-containing protein [Thermoanaerobaculaceae bacterium]
MGAAGTDLDRALVRVLNDLEALRRSLRLYPASHPALKPARERIRATVQALGGEGKEAVLSFGPDQLFWNGEKVSLPPAAPAARLVGLLFHLGLAALRLRFPEASDGLSDLVGRIATLHEPPQEEERASLLAGAGSLTGVELVPLDLSGVQLVSPDAPPRPPGSRPVWAELAGRLARDGALPIVGKIHEGELTPGMVLDLLPAVTDPETLFDRLFAQLGEIVRAGPDSSREMTLAQTREFLTELVGLLDPERQKLAVAVALRHLPVVGERDLWVAAELFLDAVELMLARQLPIPDVVQRALHRMAAPIADENPDMPQEVGARARRLLAELPLAQDSDALQTAAARAQLPTGWEGSAWVRESLSELGEEQVRLHLVRLLQEVITLWPGELVAKRAALRLAEEMAAALEVGDIATAARLAPLLAATSDAEARRVASETGVPAAIRAFKAYDRSHHADLSAVLVALGESALPAVLDALADEESLAVRKRLLEVVARQGELAFPYLIPLLDDPRWFVVRNAAFLLRRLGHPDAPRLLKSRLARSQPKVVAEILKALVELRDPDWYPLMLQSLDSPDEERRRVALDVASRIRHPDVVNALLERLSARIGGRLREPFSVDLIRALGRLRDPAALPALREVLAMRQWRFSFSLGPARREAAAAVAMLEGPEARALALELGRSRDRAVAEGVRMARQTAREPEEEE